MPPLPATRRASEGGPGPGPPLPSEVAFSRGSVPSTSLCRGRLLGGALARKDFAYLRTPKVARALPAARRRAARPAPPSPGPRPAGPGRAAAGGDDVRLGEAHPVPGAAAGDGGRGGAAALPGAVLLLGEHRGLSRAGAARRPEEHPPQHREAVSNPAGEAASAPRPPASGGTEVAPGAGSLWGSRRPWWGWCGGVRSLPFPCCRPVPVSWRCAETRERWTLLPARCLSSRQSRGEERGSRRRGEQERGRRRGGHHPGPGGAPRRRRSGLSPLLPPPRRRPFLGKVRYCGLLSPRRWGRAGPRARAGPGAGGGAPRGRSAGSRPAAALRGGAELQPRRGSAPAQAGGCLWARARWGVTASFPSLTAPSCALTGIPPPPLSAFRDRPCTLRLGYFIAFTEGKRVVGYLSYQAAFEEGLRSGRGEHVVCCSLISHLNVGIHTSRVMNFTQEEYRGH